MEPRNVIMWILLPVLVVLAMSTGVQAQELREVPASEILEKIQAGEDVNYTNVRVTGELNMSKIELETILIKHTPTKFVKSKFVKRFGLEEELKIVESEELKIVVESEELKIVECEIVIINSIFENNVDFSKTQFRKTLDFRLTSFSTISDFTNANFGGDADFWGTKFDGDADFKDTDFGGYTKFAGAKFGRDANFWGAKFDNNADFKYVGFDGDAGFCGTTFYDNADFLTANFSGNVSFFGADFGGNADFKDADFGGNADFKDADFGGDADFKDADFGGDANFKDADFGGDANFKYMDFRRDIVFDRQVYIKLIKDFRDDGLFDDANNIYYQSRKQESQDLLDAFMRRSCGYGVRPWYAVAWATVIIFVFSLIYWLGNGIRRSKESDEDNEQNASVCALLYSTMVVVATIVSFTYLYSDCGVTLQYTIILAVAMILIYIRRQYKLRFFRWQNQTDATYEQGCKYVLTLLRFRDLKKLNLWRREICRLENNIDKKGASFCDAFYFSVTTFTTLGYGDWHPKNFYRILAVIEGLLGWLTLALFLVTLANVMIRP